MKYFPNSKQVQNDMLDEIGVSSIDEFFSGIPDELRLKEPLSIAQGMDEFTLLKHLKGLASPQDKNISFLGAGSYRRHIPSAIAPIVSRSEFQTCYTPYQPEVSQGTLQAMFEFQTLLAQLTGMEIANASMYEAASATAEAILMALRIYPKKDKVLVSEALHPEYLDCVRTYLKYKDITLIEVPINSSGQTEPFILENMADDNTACGVFPLVNFYGVIDRQKEIFEILNKKNVLAISVIQDMTCLGILTPPGDHGADIVVGEGQSLGMPVSYGGPNLGIFASKKKYARQMPGRLSGLTVDSRGNKAFCLTLSTREQHIRREKATSNICSNQTLCALWVTVYLSLLGKNGLKEVALLNFNKTRYAIDKLNKIEGVSIRYKNSIYNEFIISLPNKATLLYSKFLAKNIYPGVPLSKFYEDDIMSLLINITEINTKEEIDTLIEAINEFKL